jgi:CheY-like chemotaxis protein
MTKKKVLVVDDEVTFTRLMKMNIEKSGPYEVREANKGLEALAVAREYKPDIIFLDIIMPDIAGGDLAAQIRADKEIGATPILFLTAIVSKTQTAETSGTIGGFPVIAKPVEVAEMVRAIEKNLNGKTKTGRV